MRGGCPEPQPGSPLGPESSLGPSGPDGLFLFNLITHDLENVITQPSLQKKFYG